MVPHELLECGVVENVAKVLGQFLVDPLKLWTGLEGFDESAKVCEVEVSAVVNIRLLMNAQRTRSSIHVRQGQRVRGDKTYLEPSEEIIPRGIDI